MTTTSTIYQISDLGWLAVELKRVHRDPAALDVVHTKGGKLRAFLSGEPLLTYTPATETVRLPDGSVYDRRLRTLREPSGVIWWGTPIGYVLQRALRLQ